MNETAMIEVSCPWCGYGAKARVEVGLRDGCSDGEPDAWYGAVRCLGCAVEGPWAKADRREDAYVRAIRRWGRWEEGRG